MYYSERAMPKALSVYVFTHGHCFDGLVSAAIFQHALREQRHGDALAFTFKSCGYGPRMQTIPPGWLRGDLNAILDFRYTESPRLTHYFDHHVTAFGSDLEMRAATESGLAGKRIVEYEPTYGSCTKLIADRSERVFGRAVTGFDALVEWADVIDSARFATVDEALREGPAQRLAQIVERHGDEAFLTRCTADLLAHPLEELAALPAYEALYAPIAREREAYARLLEGRAQRIGDVVYVDVVDQVTRPAGKFLPYALHPGVPYSVLVMKTEHLIKVSIGHNPWSPGERRHDIAAICRKNGGGGHPFVGAFSLKLGEEAAARERARAIVDTLNAT